jgi:soluble lytic murein transglycosylase-like protein
LKGREKILPAGVSAFAANIAIILLLLPALAQAFCFDEAGRQYGVSPRLLQGIAKVESGMNPSATNVNSNGSIDLGLMQINSFWLKPLGATKQELIDKPCYNVMVGAWILSDCLERHGKTWKAIGCYNASSHDKRVNYSWKVYRELMKDTKVAGRSGSTRSTTLRIPPSRKAADRAEASGADVATAPPVSTIQMTVTDKD